MKAHNNNDSDSFDQLLSQLSTRLINSEPDETQSCTAEVIAAFGHYVNADRCYVFEFDPEIQRMNNTHEWVRNDFSAHIDDLQNISAGDLPFFFNQMRNNFRFIIDDVETLPKDASNEYAEFQRESIKSVICIGLVAHQKLLGFVGCDMIRQKHRWTQEDIQRLSLVSDMLANSLERQNTYQKLIETQRQLEEANLKLQAQATQDGLTAIANRRALDEKLESEVKRAKRQRTGIAVLLIDIDHFKPYNDYYGHLKGDAVLRSVAECLSNIMQRSTDFVARYGGEEFAVVMSTDSAWQALRKANELLDAIESLEIEHKKSSTEPYVTVSIGGYFEQPSIDSDIPNAIKRLLDNADKGLYQAKSDGRNCIRFR
ncbi:sensor domain-containing diguanylate cyclase [Idiomarina seosinensis]|uniref:diguanylate cyclase n=1 Tax=Idiomarina seosinensis TaxID=281739 RepID=A0A432Z6Q4_9GAMM|nr:sensor domain-containing diguanylate cyclase [Idiomarina seosinensis]RUO73570.1 sensor domain-containing diguanylate cyclase [Idiomarina seosinensis]